MIFKRVFIVLGQTSKQYYLKLTLMIPQRFRRSVSVWPTLFKKSKAQVIASIGENSNNVSLTNDLTD